MRKKSAHLLETLHYSYRRGGSLLVTAQRCVLGPLIES
jgi:hypothetical protein